MSARIYDRYTPMDLKKLLKLMAKYPDIRIVLDGKYGVIDTVKREFKLILSTAKSLKLTGVLDRMIVELYNEDMYSAVKKIHAFPDYMLALYKIFTGAPSESAFRSVAEYCRDKSIPVIVMVVSWWNPAYVDIAADCGVKLALYTVNSDSEAQAFFDAGVIALFTDTLPPV
jgi:glycerophosphoryl diester phosphodiesterase